MAYLPGVGPRKYKSMQELSLELNELTSMRTQIPYDFYSLPFCPLANHKMKRESLGEQLEGEVKEESAFKLNVNQQTTCAQLCERELNAKDIKRFQTAINEEYQVQMSVDGLPAARKEELVETADMAPYYSRGYPVGFITNDDDKKHYNLNNHLQILVAINKVEGDAYHVVGFLVVPFSFNHKAQPGVCNEGITGGLLASQFQRIDEPTTVRFTYDVVWDEADMPWTQRWDIYMHGVGDQIHWFSITNSSLIVLFLTALVAMIMLRALRSDIARYNAAELEEAKEESGWKLVHGDVFRPPHTLPTLFAVFIGTGVQLAVMTFLVLFFAMLGLVSPAQRGNILTCIMLLFVLMGAFAGYHAARIHKMFRGTSWLKVTLLAATLYPAVCFAIFFLINFALRMVGSTAAVSFSALATIMLLWLTVQAPLVFIGSYYGFKKELPEQPVRTNQIPRQVPPQPWFLHPAVALPFGGILPFGAVSVELYFILTAVWLQQLYYIFGFLLLVMVILVLTCAEISIVLCYFQLCAEDHRWWWRSVQWAGSCAGYMFLYSMWYYLQDLQMSGFVPALMYFGYSALLAVSFALVTGTIGYFSCLWFITRIYSSIKVD
ncbi:EMP/nonaspanin domain family protein [Tribonema minus]|uniref:Transmembrane 9 superfamily member n=1 Tax=Tribonema minus TaxID=303371 RepID=A0A835Z917_9STRA|nr:EMP/nonaspanin domain family protein [Tribonema minus]